MSYYIGIDLGTSSVKTILMDSGGKIIASDAEDYQFDTPINGFAEQNPEVWWSAFCKTIQKVLIQFGKKADLVKGISFSGQMHGLVALDSNKKVIRPSILHCDARSYEQVLEINKTFNREEILKYFMNPIYTGFLIPSLLWLKEKEPENYARIKYTFLPKDYIKYRLTGEINCDYSDASATLGFDIENSVWSKEILERLGIDKTFFPNCNASIDCIGSVTKEAAEMTGLMIGTPVMCGGADQVMQSIGNGVIEPGRGTVNIGTSGQVCVQSEKALKNPDLNTNTFCGYDKNRWYTMGAIMNAGLSFKWFNQLIGTVDYKDLDKDIETVKAGSGGIIFLPYLNGERTPHLNPNISGVFMGVNLNTKKPQMARSVMEGVTYALCQSMEIITGLGIDVKEMVASGGGARSKTWLQMQSDIFGIPLKTALVQEQAGYGAAIVAATGAGEFLNIEEACRNTVKYHNYIYEPNCEAHKIYQEYFDIYKKTYVKIKEVLQDVTELGRRE